MIFGSVNVSVLAFSFVTFSFYLFIFAPFWDFGLANLWIWWVVGEVKVVISFFSWLVFCRGLVGFQQVLILCGID